MTAGMATLALLLTHAHGARAQYVAKPEHPPAASQPANALQDITPQAPALQSPSGDDVLSPAGDDDLSPVVEPGSPQPAPAPPPVFEPLGPPPAEDPSQGGAFAPPDANRPAATPAPPVTRQKPAAAPAPEEPEDLDGGCVAGVVCLRPSTSMVAPLRWRWPAILLASACLPLGGLWAARLAVDETARPSLGGRLVRTLLLHQLCPPALCVAGPVGGTALGTVISGVGTAVVLAVMYGFVLGVVGSLTVPGVGSTLGGIGGAVFGAVFGLLAGGIWGAMCGLALGTLPSALLGLPWQFYVGPISVLRAWNRAIAEEAAQQQPATNTVTPEPAQ